MARETKQAKRKSTNKGTTTKTAKRPSKSKKGEVAIYGGVVKCGIPEKHNYVFMSIWNDLAEYGDKECADEETTPPKYRHITPDNAANHWEEIFEDATKALWRCTKRELDIFEISEDNVVKIKDHIAAFMGNVEQAGHEVDEMMGNLQDGNYEGDQEFYSDKIMRKLHYGIFVQICWAMNSTKDYLREIIEEEGYDLGEIGVADDEDSAKKILGLLENDEIGKGEFKETTKEEAKLAMLKFCPFNDEVVGYCYLDDHGKGPINDIAHEAKVDVVPFKRALLAKLAGKKNFSSEKVANDYRKRLVKAAEELELDVSEELSEIENALERLDREYRTVDGREFATRKEAEKQRELAEFERKLDLSNEDAALKAKSELERFIKKLGVDGLWKLTRVNDELERFDRMARRAGERIFETREEAAKQRKLVDFEKNGKITDEASALKLKSDIIALAKRLGIDGTWKLERVNGELKRFDKLARTAFGTEYSTREEALAKRNSLAAFFTAVEEVISSAENAGFYFKDAIPPKKLAGARTYLIGAQDNDVFALVDTTIFGSAKIGLVISRWGIIWKNDTVATTKNAYSWKELAALDAPSKPDRGEITFEKGVVFDFTNSNGDADVCRDVLARVINFAKEATCLDSLANVQAAASSDAAVDMSKFSNLSCSCLFIANNIPDKKRRNAFISMKVKEAIDSISLLIDSTVWGSAKEGLLITNEAVYFKNFLSEPIRTSLESIKTVSARKDAIVINSKTFQSINVPINILKIIAQHIKMLSKNKRS